VHYGGAWPNNKSSEVKWDGGDLSTAFHTFGVEWDANTVKWYVDGTVPHLRPAGGR
jgi:beta-glucanase (GH16 family)